MTQIRTQEAQRGEPTSLRPLSSEWPSQVSWLSTRFFPFCRHRGLWSHLGGAESASPAAGVATVFTPEVNNSDLRGDLS